MDVSFPWFPLDPLFEKENENLFLPLHKAKHITDLFDPGHDFKGHSNLHVLTLTEQDKGTKKVEFDRVSRMLERFLHSDRDNGRFAEVVKIDKIEYFKNPNLESQFKQTWDQFILKSYSFNTPAQWDKHQLSILQQFNRFTVQMNGLQNVNLVPAWRGSKKKSYYLIGEEGHLTPQECRSRGITLEDEGFFGSGIYMTQYPSYGFQYAVDDVLLLSWVLMGRVYPVTESVHDNALKGKPVLEGYDSHYILTRRWGKFADVAPMDASGKIDLNGDELLVRLSSQCLPRYLVHFKRAPIRRRTGQAIPLELRNAKLIILWFHPDPTGLKSSLYIDWLNEYIPERLTLVITFMSLDCLNGFLFDYSKEAIFSKFKCVIHIEANNQTTVWKQLASRKYSDTDQISKIPLIIFMGHVEDIPHHQSPQKLFQQRIYNGEIHHPKLVYCNLKYKLLSHIIPQKPVFAFSSQTFGTKERPPGAQDFRHLTVTIIEANELALPNLSDDSSFYCSIGFLCKKEGRVIHIQSTEHAHGITPYWNCSITYHLKHFPTSTLLITLHNKDRSEAGRVEIPLFRLEDPSPVSTHSILRGKQAIGVLEVEGYFTDCEVINCPILEEVHEGGAGIAGPSDRLSTDLIGYSSHTEPLELPTLRSPKTPDSRLTNSERIVKRGAEGSPGGRKQLAGTLPGTPPLDQFQDIQKQNFIVMMKEAWEGTDIMLFKKLLSCIPPQHIDVVNDRGQTALYCACHRGHLYHVMELLKVDGINVNKQIKGPQKAPPVTEPRSSLSKGATALHAASYYCHHVIVALLLFHGADPQLQNSVGLTPRDDAKDQETREVYHVYEQFGREGIKTQYLSAAKRTTWSPDSPSTISYDPNAPPPKTQLDSIDLEQLTMLPGGYVNQPWWPVKTMEEPQLGQLFHSLNGRFNWDNTLFKDLYTKAEKISGPQAWSDPTLCAFRIAIGAQTRDTAKREYYYTKQGKIVSIPESKPSSKFRSNPQPGEVKQTSPPADVSVIDMDTLNAAGTYLEAHPGTKVLVLNLANSTRPGGGWILGRMAQEEELFRRTNLCIALSHDLYPIPEFGALISRDISVFRSSVSDGYVYMDTPFQCDVISVSAYDQNHVKDLTKQIGPNQWGFQPHYVDRVYAKIEAIFQYISMTNYDLVVLGALGCGAFRNPPIEVAKLFDRALQKYAGLLPKIQFAILGQTNLTAFRTHIQGEYKPIVGIKTLEPIIPRCFKPICDLMYDEDHLDCYLHSDVGSPRTPCPNDLKCTKRGHADHVKTYSHSWIRNRGLVISTPFSLDSFLPSPGTPDSPILPRIPYYYNCGKLMKQITEFCKSNNQHFIDYTTNTTVPAIEDWLSRLLPIHRMNKDAFFSVIDTGGLMSLHQLRTIDADAILPLVVSKPSIEQQMDVHGTEMIKGYIKTLIQWAIVKIQQENQQRDPSIQQQQGPIPIPIQQIKKEYEEKKEEVKSIPSVTLKQIKHDVISMTRAALSVPRVGLDFEVDKILGTHKTIFTVYGPNKGNCYGHIHVIMKESIKWHPNFYILPHAATLFYDQERIQTANTTRPWADKFSPEEWKPERRGAKNFHESKFHPVAPDTWKVIAMDLIIRVAHIKKIKLNDVTFDMVQEWWKTVDSHQVLEAHLPSQVPLSYIEGVVMSTRIWESFSKEQQILAKQTFNDNLHITGDENESFNTSCTISTQPRQQRYEGFCFLIPPSSTLVEWFIPLKLVPRSSTKLAFIAFESIGHQFILNVFSQEKGISISTVFDGLSDSISISCDSPHQALSNPRSPLVNTSFYEGIQPNRKIRYLMTLDGARNIITLRHYGPSAVQCESKSLSYEMVDVSKLCYFSFYVYGKETVELYNVRTLMDPIP